MLFVCARYAAANHYAAVRKPAVLFTSGITMNNNKTWDRTENLDLEICHKRINLMYHWIEKML